MECDFDYCIYNNKNNCILKETRINSVGMCDSCIVVALAKEKLEEYKNYQLQEIERRN